MSDETELTIVHGQTTAEETVDTETVIDLSQGGHTDGPQSSVLTETRPEDKPEGEVADETKNEAMPQLIDLPGMQESYPLPTPEVGEMTPPSPPEK